MIYLNPERPFSAMKIVARKKLAFGKRTAKIVGRSGEKWIEVEMQPDRTPGEDSR